ncbi:3'-5' exonuclease [Pelagibaculum spongiae]|uniref:3'-5' exonuclease n=1 Tax=Pelagibaculum spongiae TaxID=2080658 RepID=A0A2V1GUC9_9GAMM|nr:3'-5' exonuclease [Pelagibaculum spongiae]PVZ69619.1 3'-5' exonuclease [Pelagibaculum spongiae]
MLQNLLPGKLKSRWLNYQLNKQQHEFADCFQPAIKGEIISLDMETSSLDTQHAEILEIAAVPIRHGKIYPGQTLELRVKPLKALNPTSVPIHQIREIDLQQALGAEQAIKQLIQFIGARPLLGYNIRFDQKILNRYYKALLGFELPNPTLELSHRYYKKKLHSQPDHITDLRLETICSELDIPMLDRHSAKGDALTVALAWSKLGK